MVASKYERSLFQLRFYASTFPRSSSIVPVTFAAIIEMLRSCYAAKTAIAYLDPSGRPRLRGDEDLSSLDIRNAVYIRDWQSDDDGKYEYLLLHRGDPDEVHPSFVNSSERSSQTVTPPDGLAPGRSAHLCISMNLKKDHYRGVLEHATGINRGLVINFFNALLAELAASDPKFTYQKKKKKGVYETKKYRPTISVDAPPSASLVEDIRNGTVTGIDLIRRTPTFKGIDFDDKIKPKNLRLELSVQENADDNFIIQKIKSLSKHKDFNEIQVHIKELDGHSASPRASMQMFEAQELLYSRKTTASNFDDPMTDACYDEIQSTLTSKMIDVIENERW